MIYQSCKNLDYFDFWGNKYFQEAKYFYITDLRLVNILSLVNLPYFSLREKCPGTEYFLVRVFPHSD